MKKLLLISALLTTLATNAQAISWESSCGSSYSKEFFKPNYSFTVRHGEVGGCPDDKLSHFGWEFSERQEVHSKPFFTNGGKWEWTATVNIDRACKPATRSTIVQIHGGHNTAQRPQGNPSFLAVNWHNNFRGQGGGFSNGYATWGHGDTQVPNRPFHVRMVVEWTKGKYIKSQYWIDGKYLGMEQTMAKGFSKLYFKFGVYRVNSNCDITQTYKDVKVRKVK